MKKDGGPDVDTGRSDAAVPLWVLATALLRWRRTILISALTTGLLGVGLALTARRVYSSGATFIPTSSSESINASSGLALAASQLGLSVPTSRGGAWGPPVYAQLLRSRDLLEPIAHDTVAVAEQGGKRVAVMDLLQVKGATPTARTERALTALRKIVTASDDKELQAVTLTVTTRWPSVSLWLAQRLIQSVNRFNLEKRRSQAAAERQFVDQQAKEAEHALRDAEDQLQTFLQGNRDIGDSPKLVFTRDRLQREVDLRQQVYTTLAQNLEEARIREVRDTPVITVITTPWLPVLPESRRVILKALLGGIAGAILGILIAAVLQQLTEARRARAGEAHEFLLTLREATPRLLGGRRR